MRLFHKFLLMMFLSGFIPVLWLGVALINKSQFSLETPISELHIKTVEGAAGRIGREFDALDAKAVLISRMMGHLDWDARQGLFSSVLETESYIKNISAVASSGEEVIKAGNAREKKTVLENLSSSRFFIEAKKKKVRIVQSDVRSGILNVLYPYDKFYLRFEVYAPDFFSRSGLGRTGETGISMVVDEKGNPLYVPPGIPPDEAAGSSSWPITTQALKNLSSASMSFTLASGEDFIGAYAYLPAINGAVIVKQSRTDAYKYALSIKDEAAKVVLFFVVLVVLLAYFFSKNLSRPVISITKAAEFVAKGDFTHKVKVDTNDELKDLAETFNEMVVQLRKYSEMQIDRILRERKNTQAVLFSTEDGIIMVDPHRRIQLINRKGASIFKINQETAENSDIVSAIKDENLRGKITELLDKADEKYVIELEIELANSRRIFRTFMREMTLPDRNEKLGYLIAAYDITLDKELERIKEEFLHSITHDLRNPMGAIKGFVEFMLKGIPGPINETQKKMLVSIDRASFRLLGMINNILDIAKMEAGKMELNLSSFSMKEISARVFELMDSFFQRKRIKFSVDAEEDVKIDADQNLIERLLINLIGNSIKFTPEGGSIIIGFRKEEGLMKGWVEDTGEGIPLDYVDKVFEKFEQVKGQKAGGTGLGLTISKHIAEAHGGKIWAEYREGKGAKFVFTIPLSLRKDEHGRVVKGDA